MISLPLFPDKPGTEIKVGSPGQRTRRLLSEAPAAKAPVMLPAGATPIIWDHKGLKHWLMSPRKAQGNDWAILKVGEAEAQ